MSKVGLALAGLGVLVLAVVVYWLLTPGVRVSVLNSDAVTRKSVSVRVTGRVYSVGDLKPGERKSVRVQPKGESDIFISFIDSAGKEEVTAVGPYIEKGYRGHIDVEIKDGKAVKVREKVKLYSIP